MGDASLPCELLAEEGQLEKNLRGKWCAPSLNIMNLSTRKSGVIQVDTEMTLEPHSGGKLQWSR